MAYGSVCEVDYQIGLAHRLGYLSQDALEALHPKCKETAKVLNGLICSLRSP